MGESLLYSKTHMWVKHEDSETLLGLTSYALAQLKTLLFINLPEAGDALNIGEVCGDVESIKTVSDLVSPVAGTVLSVNEDIMAAPELIKGDDVGCWLIKAANANDDGSLMDLSAYQQYTQTL